MAITSLFGPTPAQIEQARQLQLDQQIAGEGAELGPFRGLYQAGRRLTSAGTQGLVSGLFPEAADPAMRQAQAVQMVQQKYQGQNLSDPTVLKSIASDLFNAGAPDAGLRILKTAQDLTPKKERINVAAGGTVIDESGNVIFQAPDKTKTPSALEQADRIRLEELQTQYGPVEGAKRFRQERDEVAKKNAEASASKLSLEGQKNVLSIDEKDAVAYQEQRNSARKALTSLSRMQELMQQGVISGTAQEARLGFLRTLGTLGVNTKKAENVVSNTEQFDKEVRTLLLAIIKQLGYNPSNADVRFALDSLPSLTNSAAGLQEIVNRFYKVNKDTLEESNRALSYFRQNKGSFEGFTPNIDVWSPKTVTPQDLSDSELQRRLKEARSRNQ